MKKFSENQLKRLSGSGKEMIERRLRAREAEEASTFKANKKSILGAAAIYDWKRVSTLAAQVESKNRAAKIREEIGVEGVSEPDVYDEMYAGAKRSFDRKYYGTERSLAIYATRDRKGVEDMFATYLGNQDPAVLPEILKHAQLPESQPHEVRALASTIATRYAESSEDSVVMPPEFLLPVLEDRQRRIEAEMENFKEQIEPIAEIAQEKVESAIEDKKLPIRPSVAKERLDALGYEVIDPWTADLYDVYGDYDASTHRSRIAYNAPKEYMERILMHEMFHALSGRTEYKDPFEGLEGIQRRVGFRISNTRPNPHFGSEEEGISDKLDELRVSPKHPNFRWLNEAVTEQLTLETGGYTDVNTYKHERRILKELTSRRGGIDKQLFYKAYFENTPAGNVARSQHPTPAMNKLFTAANSRIGTRALINLDTLVSISGVKAVADQLAEFGPRIALASFERHKNKKLYKE